MPTSIVKNPTEVFTIEPADFAKLDGSMKAEHARIAACCAWYKSIILAYPQWSDTSFHPTQRQQDILHWVAERIRRTEPEAEMSLVPYGLAWFISREWPMFSVFLRGDPVSYILT